MSDQSGALNLKAEAVPAATADFKLSKARMAAGLSQQQLAESSACTLSKIRAIEAGKVSLGDIETARVLIVLLERLVGDGSSGRGFLELMRSYQKLPDRARSGLRQFLRNLDD